MCQPVSCLSFLCQGSGIRPQATVEFWDYKQQFPAGTSSSSSTVLKGTPPCICEVFPDQTAQHQIHQLGPNFLFLPVSEPWRLQRECVQVCSVCLLKTKRQASWCGPSWPLSHSLGSSHLIVSDLQTCPSLGRGPSCSLCLEGPSPTSSLGCHCLVTELLVQMSFPLKSLFWALAYQLYLQKKQPYLLSCLMSVVPCPLVTDWIVFPTPPHRNSFVEVLTPIPQNVTVSGDGTFKEVITLKWGP